MEYCQFIAEIGLVPVIWWWKWSTLEDSRLLILSAIPTPQHCCESEVKVNVSFPKFTGTSNLMFSYFTDTGNCYFDSSYKWTYSTTCLLNLFTYSFHIKYLNLIAYFWLHLIILKFQCNNYDSSYPNADVFYYHLSIFKIKF